MDDILYISFGSDCGCASALNHLKLRNFSLPFDWIVSSYDKIEKCINEDFNLFHKNIILNDTKKRIIDGYGFEFPHDYPFNSNTSVDIINNDNTIFGENIICENYMNYYNIVYEKYTRRIERFKTIMNSDKNIIILYRGNIKNAEKILNLIKNKYNKDNIMIICNHFDKSNNNKIINCNVDEFKFNDADIWNENIKKCIECFKHHKYLD
jgi:hypothetical protein